jgi:hypothetical protein
VPPSLLATCGLERGTVLPGEHSLSALVDEDLGVVAGLGGTPLDTDALHSAAAPTSQ